MKHQTTSPKKLKFRLFTIVFVLVLFSGLGQAAETTVFHDDLEGDWTADWHADAGTWEVGIPTSGPNEAHSEQKCAATILNGNYTTSVNSRIIRHTSFVVPEVSEDPRLRFWHWYSFSSGDYGKVQIKIDGTTDWIDISTSYTNTGSSIWTYPSIDLSDYAGESVQIAFFFHSDTYSNSTGWYIDDVSVISGATTFNFIEGWENGMGDWAAERGTWEVGNITNGPDVYDGDNCIATILSGDYTTAVSSRFISPEFIVPSSSENPRLRFWHWYSFSSGDYGKVQIRVSGTSDWVDISTSYINTGGNLWTYPSIDLSEYTDQKVQISFYFYSDTYSNSLGWYIDNMELVTGSSVFNNPEDWEDGIGDWASESGTWQVGIPNSGPNVAFSGDKCAATVLDGSYTTAVSSRLISPVFKVPASAGNPVLRFRHWYSFSSGDYGKVQIKIQGTADWEDITNAYYINTGGDIYTYTYLPIADYAERMVRIAFLFHSDTYSNSTGWYIDDILIEGLPTSVEDTPESSGTYLSQNVPNPFSSSTLITYSLKEVEYVCLTVYNEVGQVVRSLINQTQQPGKYTIDFSANGLSDGIYFYQLKHGNGLTETKKMIKSTY